MCRYRATTPSSFACHPSTGGELPCADTGPPPRQASLDTPPQEGNCPVQIPGHHPVKLRLPPLHRRGIALCRYGATTPSSFACHPSIGGELPCADTGPPPRQASLATPPQEGNCPVQIRSHHPVRLRRRVQTRCNRPSVSVLDISPPQEGNGPPLLVDEFGGSAEHHPIKLRLPPLHRRGIALCRTGG